MSKKLKTLEEHNNQYAEFYDRVNNSIPNGIECPNCKTELMDTNPMAVLLVYPPRVSIHCPKCGFKGTRLA